MNGHVIYWIGKTKEEKRITSVLCGYVKFKIPRKPGSGDISQMGDVWICNSGQQPRLWIYSKRGRHQRMETAQLQTDIYVAGIYFQFPCTSVQEMTLYLKQLQLYFETPFCYQRIVWMGFLCC